MRPGLPEWTPAEQARFEALNREEAFRGYRLSTSLASVLFPAGATLDLFTQPQDAGKLLAIRGTTTLIFLGLWAAARKGRPRSISPQLIGMASMILCSISITSMCLVLTGYRSPYYAGINLIMLFIGITFPWSVRRSATAVFLVLGIYLGAVLAQTRFVIDRPDILFNSLFFLFCTATISISSSRLFDLKRRESFSRLLAAEQAQARAEEYDRIKTQFFANVSHELRTPLALILGPAEKLLSSGSPGDGPNRELRVIVDNARLLLGHVNDLLDVAKLEAGRLEARLEHADLSRILRRSVSLFEPLAAELGSRFEVEAPACLPARADAEKIQRVLINLMSNAFKFSGRAATVRCTLRATEDQALLVVEDSGPGVPADLRESVFRRFFQGEESATRRFGGTGLGLAICKDFVELHGGRIQVDQSPELGGARFTVSLPLLASDPAQSRAEPREEALEEPGAWKARQLLEDLRQSADNALERTELSILEAAADERIRPLALVVEDNPEMRRHIEETLSPDFDTLSARDGREGLDLARRVLPDLIVTDIMMPVMSGVQMVGEIRRTPELDPVPILILSAKADAEPRERLLLAGAEDYLIKPFSESELRARAGNLARQKRARTVLQRELATREGDLDALARDLASRRRELEEAIARMRAAREEARAAYQLREEFIQIASHELRTPITSMKLFAQYLSRKAPLSESLPSSDVLQFATLAQSQLGRMQALVEDMLDASFAGTGQLRMQLSETRLADACREAVERQRETLAGAGCEVRLQLDDSILGIWDRRRLEQVFLNLLSNSAKYAPGSRIQISAERGASGRALIRFEDDGPGIPEGMGRTIFDKFVRGVGLDKTSGFGLGLYISRAVVEQHQGSIRLVDGRERGTEFVIELPALPAADPATG